MRGWNRVWVGFTVSLISFISFSSQIFVIWPWYGSVVSVDLIKLLAPFNFLVFMVFWNYRLCVVTRPGGVPYGWRPNLSSLEGMEVKRGSHGPRYCKTCQHYKPPRAHHCRQCNTCVLKLDHHCPWIANCVGFYNHGHFIRFLVWVSIATSYHLAMIFFRVRDFVLHPWPEPTLMEMLFMIFNFASCGPVFVCVSCFGIYHCYLVSGNSTTIERWEKDKVATLVRRGKIKEVKYPYHLGTMKNLKAVLGDNPAYWLWPKQMKGDGLSFPVNPGVELAAQYLWPPVDPTRLPDPIRPGNRQSSSAFTYGNDGLNPNLIPSTSRNGSVNQNHNYHHHDHVPQYSYPPSQSQYSGIPPPQIYSTYCSESEYSSTNMARPSRRRRRDLSSTSPWQVEVGSEGEGLDSDRSDSYSSSPEPYLSDYDHDDEGPAKGIRPGHNGFGFSQDYGNGHGQGDFDEYSNEFAHEQRSGGRREDYETMLGENNENNDDFESDDGGIGDGFDQPRVRQGSEGLEVAWAERPWEQPGRYNVY